MMHINILLCDTFPGRLPDFIPNYESLFFDLFDSIGVEATYRIYQTWQGELPSTVNPDELYLVPGSLDSAYDDKPWIVSLLHWIEKAYCRGAKMMGVCFGHQVIARALGGEVRKYDGGFGAGVRQSRVISDFCLNESYRIGRQVVTFQGHPEFTVAYSRHLLTNCSDDLDEVVRLKALHSLDEKTPMGPAAARFALDLLNEYR